MTKASPGEADRQFTPFNGAMTRNRRRGTGCLSCDVLGGRKNSPHHSGSRGQIDDEAEWASPQFASILLRLPRRLRSPKSRQYGRRIWTKNSPIGWSQLSRGNRWIPASAMTSALRSCHLRGVLAAGNGETKRSLAYGSTNDLWTAGCPLSTIMKLNCHKSIIF